MYIHAYVLLISLLSLSLPHILVAADIQHIEADWRNCSPVQVGIVTEAWGDAFKMAEKMQKFDWNENPAALDFIGAETLNTNGTSSLAEVFQYVTRTDSKPRIFCGTADANYGVPTTCADSWIYGGIFSSSIRNLTMLFCDEFFMLPSLQARLIEVEQFYKAPWIRLDLMTYHPNQGTSILRELISQVPVTSTRQKGISKTWVRVLSTSPKGEGEAYVGCYGPICTKLLARLHGTNWSTVNADNYATLALSEHVKDALTGTYTWLPRLDQSAIQGPNMVIAIPTAIQSSLSTLVRVNTSVLAMASLNYATYIMKNGSGPPENSAAHLQTLDIREVRYRRDDLMSPSQFKERDEAVDHYRRCSDSGLVNCGLAGKFACESKNLTTIASQRWELPQTRAEELVRQYCTLVKDNSSTEIVPPILTGSWVNTATQSRSLGSYWNQPIGNGSHLNLAIELDRERCETPFNLATAFEGKSDPRQGWGKEKGEKCIDTFTRIINGCNIDAMLAKRSGMFKIGCKIFTALVTSPEAVLQPPNINDMGRFVCTPSNLTTAWRHKRYGFDVAKTCTCWFEKLPRATEMFCPPPGGSCESITAPPPQNARDILTTTGKYC